MITKYRRIALTFAFAGFLTVALVACGGVKQAAVTSDAGSEPSPTQVGAASTNVREAAAPVVGSAPAVGAALADADAIVAAHEQVLSDIYESVLPSVVRIEVTQEVDAQSFGRQGGPPLRSSDEPDPFFRRGEGSGFVWTEEGHVVTNHHVIADADRVTVVFAAGSEYEADVLGSDPDSDLAVLKVRSHDKQFTPIGLGDSGALRVGQLAVAIGAPFGQEFTMTRGIVSALGRMLPSGFSKFNTPDVIQTDAPINPRNSGGPLLDRRGNVIGINSQIISRSGSSSGVGFAVPIDIAKRVVPDLMATGEYQYPYLGITGGTLRPRLSDAGGLPEGTRGVLIAEVVEGGPAAEAGIQESDDIVVIDGTEVPVGGDVITGIDGISVQTMDALIAHLVENNRPGDVVTLEVLRDGDALTSVEVTLSPRPEPAAEATRPS